MQRYLALGATGRSDLPRPAEAKVTFYLLNRRGDPSFQEGKLNKPIKTGHPYSTRSTLMKFVLPAMPSGAPPVMTTC
jgi:hypothetical protein